MFKTLIIFLLLSIYAIHASAHDSKQEVANIDDKIATIEPNIDDKIAKKIVTDVCQHCHGIEGEASNVLYPRLAGQHKNYIIKQLHDFRSGQRKGTMNEMAKDLKDDEIVALATYFSGKPTRKHRVRNKEFAQVGWYIFHRGNEYSGIPACASCHGENGEGSDTLPRLAGQHKRYVTDQLQQFIEDKRVDPIMHSVAKKLTKMEIEAVASYVSGLK
ncbi:MAG: cytochrome c4 [Gammaproteobacteria bacterium]|nr:cytochrome c4 [Gammaproteobacteria bacterium]